MQSSQPETQDTTKDWSSHEFKTPTKELNVIELMETFKKGKTYANYMQFIADLQQSVTSKKISQTPLDPKFEPIAKMLEDFKQWITEIPPIKQPMRFGNKAFCTWHEKVQAVISCQII